VQLGEDHLDTAELGARLDVDGDATGAVDDVDAAVGLEAYVDLGPEAGQRLVDGIVDDLPQAVHEPAGVGGADVHGRALADGFEALQHQQVPGFVVAAFCGGLGRGHRLTLSRPRNSSLHSRDGVGPGMALSEPLHTLNPRPGTTQQSLLLETVRPQIVIDPRS